MAGRDVRNMSTEDVREKARMIRLETLRLADICGSGHYGSVFSMAELLASLYYRFLHVNANEPEWAHRDRFLLGKGHAAIGQFPVLADLGFFPDDWLDQYTRFGSPLGDHPDMRKVPGVDFSSGSIGHNLSVAVGMAAGLLRKESPARIVCMMGDGEQAEGQIWEAAVSAAHWKLDHLVGIVDINGAGSDGDPQEIMNTEPLADKWEAFGWRVLALEDGHDIEDIAGALDQALNRPDGRPTCVLAHTVAGRGVSFMEGGWEWHLGFLGPKDLERAYREVQEGTIG